MRQLKIYNTGKYDNCVDNDNGDLKFDSFYGGDDDDDDEYNSFGLVGNI